VLLDRVISVDARTPGLRVVFKRRLQPLAVQTCSDLESHRGSIEDRSGASQKGTGLIDGHVALAVNGRPLIPARVPVAAWTERHCRPAGQAAFVVTSEPASVGKGAGNRLEPAPGRSATRNPHIPLPKARVQDPATVTLAALRSSAQHLFSYHDQLTRISCYVGSVLACQYLCTALSLHGVASERIGH
jgi:hypothetical protein